jgi:hypothetical protein
LGGKQSRCIWQPLPQHQYQKTSKHLKRPDILSSVAILIITVVTQSMAVVDEQQASTKKQLFPPTWRAEDSQLATQEYDS